MSTLDQGKDRGDEPYEPPELTEHGTVEDLTRAINSGIKDGLAGSGGI